MNGYERGDVVLLPFPFTNLTTAKQRPAVVLSPHAFNMAHPDVIVAAVTSRVSSQRTPDDVELTTDDLQRGGLPKPSLVKPGKIVTIDQRLVRKKIGRLTEASMRTIQGRLRVLLT